MAKKIALVFILLFAPLQVFAHASPVRYEITDDHALIEFTENIESGSIQVTAQDGRRVDEGLASIEGRTISVRTTEEAYAISWQVTSADDGHFSRGTYSPTATEIEYSQPVGTVLLIWLELLVQAFLIGGLAIYLYVREPRGKPVWNILWIPILAFTYTRVLSSHAAASHFHPHISVFINFIHLVFKDLWVGGVIVLALTARKMLELRTKFSKLISWALVLGGSSGAYVVWLHLKRLGNILTTPWGHWLIVLSVLGGALLVLHIYQIWKGPRRSVLIAEAIVGAALLLATSRIIITSPPL